MPYLLSRPFLEPAFHSETVNFLYLSLTPCCYVELSFVLYFLAFISEMRLLMELSGCSLNEQGWFPGKGTGSVFVSLPIPSVGLSYPPQLLLELSYLD
jgi:hypothetical protein